MKYIYLIILNILTMLLGSAQTIEVSGIISTNTTWNADTILLIDDVLIPQNVELQITHGTQILAEFQKRITVKGSIKALGQEGDYIHFEALDTLGLSDTTTVAGTWGGIHFIDLNEEQDSSILDYCIIRHGGAYGTTSLERNGGAIFIHNSSKIRISNSIIQYNIAQQGGGGIHLHENSSAHIYSNLISNNTANDEGGGIMCFEESDPLIEKNTIIHNIAWTWEPSELIPGAYYVDGRGGGVCISSLSTNKYTTVQSNIVCNNYSIVGAIYESGFKTKVYSNIVCNNYGSGIVAGFTAGEEIIANNTVVNNYYGYGIAMFLSDNIALINNISYNNHHYYLNQFIDTIDLYYPEVNTTNFLHNNIVSASDNVTQNINSNLESLGQGNISHIPQFLAPSIGVGPNFSGYEADWSLVEDDPSIDAGTTAYFDGNILPAKDAYGNDRIIGDAIDIGAVEYKHIVKVNTPMVQNTKFSIFPNPFSGQIWIEQKGETTSLLLQVHDQTGRLIQTLDFDDKIIGLQTANWAKGTYVLNAVRKDDQTLAFTQQILKIE